MRPPIKQPLTLDAPDKLVKHVLQSIHIDNDDTLDLSSVSSEVLYKFLEWPREDIRRMCFPFYQVMRHNKANPETFAWAFVGAYGIVKREVHLELVKRTQGNDIVASALMLRLYPMSAIDTHMSEGAMFKPVKKHLVVRPKLRQYDPDEPF